MRKRTKRWIASYTKRGNRRQLWKKLVRLMACVVVFCTTYALILPAITMEQQYICGMESHEHGEDCYDAQAQLICAMQQHIHDEACKPDPTADLESAAHWEATMSGVDHTGNWDKDLLAIAKTQLGYTESRTNIHIRRNGEQQPYTRYGAWFYEPYGDWDAKFAAFCLNYAYVPRNAIPWDSDSGDWLSRLQSMGVVEGLYSRIPAPGELVFFTKGGGETISMGIISAVDSQTDLETGEQRVTQLAVIAGDVDGQVAEVNLPASRIAGVCAMELVLERYAEKYPGKQEHEKPAEDPSEVPTAEPDGVPGTEPVMLSQTAETENYIVVVTYSSDLVIPEGAALKATEYAKDSEIFRRRCAEAGYELDWLLNIGFFIDDREVEINGQFDVQVISKSGDDLGNDITHFDEDGAERIDATPKTDGTEEGQTSVEFPAGSFSDFGGGVATVAETGPITLTVVDPSQLVDGVEYVIFTRYGNRYLAMGNSGFSAINIGSGEAPGVGTEIDLTKTSIADCTWRLETVGNSGNFELYSTATNQRLHVDYNAVYLQSAEKQHTTTNVDGAGARLAHPWRSGWSSGTNYLRYSDGWRGTSSSSYASTVYFAMKKNYPHAVHTGTYEVGGLRFYNFCEGKNQSITALAGCTFEIHRQTGSGWEYVKTVTSGSNSEISFSLPDGSYMIKEVSAPAGYVIDENPVRYFSVENNKFVDQQAIGMFMNHKLDVLNPTKTAQVEDYTNRMYEIQMSAKGQLQMYAMDPVDVLFVVDKSNSMLFPSGMNPVQSNGADVKVTLNADGTNNLANLDRLAAEGKINRDEMYYIISDPNGSSTVWCLWHDGETWVYQDASYYAKAKHGNVDGYRQGEDTIVFPRNQAFTKNYGTDTDGNGVLAVNGGGMGHSMTDSSIATDIGKGRNTFTIYQAVGEYNRLHYLEEALSNMVIELAEMNPQNTVTLVPFTKNVDHDNYCTEGRIQLNSQGVEKLLGEIRDINTEGGTRQDIALQHVYEQHLNVWNSPYRGTDNFVVLITDGAPAGTSNIGDADDDANQNGSVYAKIKYWAEQVKAFMRQGTVDRTTLMTVALGMTNVSGGKEVLEQIASGEDMYCALDDAAALVDRIQQLIFSNMRPDGTIGFECDAVDVISESFYPVAWVPKGPAPPDHTVLSLKASSTLDRTKDWIVLKPGDWITNDGRYTTQGASDAAGQLLQNTDGDFYVQWSNLQVGNGWNGTLYVKAKEDFIGGNIIDTNKSAGIELRYPKVVGYEGDGVLPTPTVNVRLLDMNEMHSEVTVYLGDIVNEAGNSPLDALKYFYANTEFTKLISDDGKVLNKTYEGDTPPEGLKAQTFTLEYAIGRPLTDDEWNQLVDGKTVTVPYTYDYDSNNGAVGAFTLSLEKFGTGSNYAEHEATTACQPGGSPDTADCTNPAETYILNISYDAYRIGTEYRPTKNVHNGSDGPGINVGTGRTLETGLGELDKENVHEVHVISGSIEITKRFASTVTATENTTFTFVLHNTADGTDTTRDVTRTITIPAGSLEGSASIVFDNLPRGTYTVTEIETEEYAVHKIRVQTSTNCYSEPAPGSEDRQVLFRMGSNRSDANVIAKAGTDRYTSYTDSPNGVFGEAEFTNKERVYEGEIPVEKVWDDGAENHRVHEVYVVLLENGVPVLNEDGSAKLLKLTSQNNWQGAFTVTLAHKNDTVAAHNFTVREVSGISDTQLYGWQKAKVAGTDTIVYYEKVVEDGHVIGVGGNGYIVKYEQGTDGAWTVTNFRGYELPETGGMGTSHFTFGGSLMVASALMYICITGHKRQKGGR